MALLNTSIKTNTCSRNCHDNRIKEDTCTMKMDIVGVQGERGRCDCHVFTYNRSLHSPIHLRPFFSLLFLIFFFLSIFSFAHIFGLLTGPVVHLYVLFFSRDILFLHFYKIERKMTELCLANGEDISLSN